MNVETANQLVKLRKSHGLSQETLAERLGVSRQAVSKWERAESSPDTDNFIALSELYGISIDEILNGDIEISDKAIENREYKNRIKKKQEAWAAIGSVLAIIIFFLWNFIYGGWAISWVAFLIIPIFYYIPVITSRK
ncbi:MAG: helix-turn-helix transcriptional regulator [Clostridia bacterium]|nr:helix-turn-helix transcriptional regulator [Clostridia bacterium]